MPEGTVLVTARSFGQFSAAPQQLLEEAGLTVCRGAADHNPEALRRLSDRNCVAWIAGTRSITGAHLNSLPDLRIVARYGVGMDSVDLDAANERGIRVTNTPGANSDSVADHAVALLLALLRGLGVTAAPNGNPPPVRAHELQDLRIGLVGFGQVGQAVSSRLAGFRAQVAVHDPIMEQTRGRLWDVSWRSLQSLAEWAHVISLHRPGGERIVTEAFLQMLQPSALIVNTARADLVDEHAVAAALRTGALGGYATDVSALSGSPLVTAPNTLVTNHIAAHTVEAVNRMGTMAADEVLRMLRDEPARFPVTTPPLQP